MLRTRLLLLLTLSCCLTARPLEAQSPAVPEILVSRQLAEAEGLAVGDIVRLAATATGSDAREFRIAGIYEPTADPQRLGAFRARSVYTCPDLLDLTRDPATPPAPNPLTASTSASAARRRTMRSCAMSTPACLA